jgi:pimeloyl-ACP methyl ester carboxylesterase
MDETDATLIDEPSAESTRVGVEDGVDLHVVRAGDPDDPLVVMLHGFSDFWYGWRHQIPALVDAGYRVVAPDIRGFNLSDKPRGLDAYRMGRLSGDVVALIESEGRESARIVGHDMGGQISWDFAQRHPERVERLGIVNVPHLSAFRGTLWSTPRQLLRSWYGFFFQVPRLPEWLLGRNDAQGIVDILTGSSRPGAFTADELEYYRRAYTRQGASTEPSTTTGRSSGDATTRPVNASRPRRWSSGARTTRRSSPNWRARVSNTATTAGSNGSPTRHTGSTGRPSSG